MWNHKLVLDGLRTKGGRARARTSRASAAGCGSVRAARVRIAAGVIRPLAQEPSGFSPILRRAGNGARLSRAVLQGDRGLGSVFNVLLFGS